MLRLTGNVLLGAGMNFSQRPTSTRAIKGLMTISVIGVITVTSLILMLRCTSPELSWDEAVYVSSAQNDWSTLWRGYPYETHAHGPMGIYLAKLGQQFLPAEVSSLETRSRFFPGLAASLAIGTLYWMLRSAFQTSGAAALVGSSLLLFSVIRLEETNIVGPHDLMLACTLAILALGYHWLSYPSVRAGIVLGTVIGFGALSMTYVVPAALCWLLAVSLAGKKWVERDRTHLKVSWTIPLIFAITGVIVLILWPFGVLSHGFLKDFIFYLRFTYIQPTLVGDQVFEVTPRWALLYWLAKLDAPIFVSSVSIILVSFWRAFRGDGILPKHVYLAVFLVFFFATAVMAHIAGARNILQFIGVLCFAVGALFDEAFGGNSMVIRLTSAMIIVLGAINLLWFSKSSTYIPSLATDGYQEFLRANKDRLSEDASAFVYGSPILKLYAEKSGVALEWTISEVPWTTRADAPLPAGIKYVLAPEFVFECKPLERLMRRVVAEHWKKIWSFKTDRVWELRLYERPSP
jgi:hypothetical protein